MKFILVCLVLVLTGGLLLVGCYKDVNIPAVPPNYEGPPQFVSYSKELSPLFNDQCSGCHKAGGPHPHLTSDVSYNEIVNGGFVNLVVPKESILYIQINGNMQQYIPSASDRQKVYDWIRNGCPNN
jgi:hypothetical protein